jgi:hypothetical protein
MKRRKFLSVSAGVVAAAPFVFARKSSVWAAGASPLAVAYHPNACTWGGSASGVGVYPFSVDQAIVNNLVDNCVLKLTGKSTIGEAWQALFTTRGLTVSNTTKIGIKFNNAWDTGISKFTNSMCPYGPRVATVNAIISGLVQMLNGTFPIVNITVFDKAVYSNENAKLVLQGFPSSSATPYLVSGAGKATMMMADPANLGTTPITFNAGTATKNVPQKVLPVVVQQNALINVSVPKVNIGAGVTAALKNFYGTTDNCGLTHGSTTGEIANAPTITQCVPSIYKNIDGIAKCVVNVLDGIAGNYDSQAFAGPAFFKKVIAMSTDPVTLDYYAVQIVNEARRANRLSNIGTPPTSADYTTIQPQTQFPGTINADGYINAHYLAWAASSSYNLGNMNNDNTIYTDLTAIDLPGALSSLDFPQGRPLDLVRLSSGWSLNVLFDNSGRRHTVESRIVDLTGSEIRAFAMVSTRQQKATIAWDAKSSNGGYVPSGIYTWETRIDGRVYTQVVQHTR